CALLHELAAECRSPGRVNARGQALWVRAPRLALRRALGNLLENALRYSGEQPVDLSLEVSDGSALIRVADRGPGIPGDKLDDVFSPFVRLDTARSPATGGAGLGLPIVRQLARANGWQIELGPRPGGGLEARLAIPQPD
ncbi:MAG: sensor histidine kinase, partial [Zoogloea sp.]|nr:sensor histidine kinase [Zoogloea sp.]